MRLSERAMPIETSRAKIVERLEAAGYVFHRAGAEHDIYTRPGGPVAVVPRHRTLSPGVARKLQKLAAPE